LTGDPGYQPDKAFLLPAGTYSFDVLDNNGCTATSTMVINGPASKLMVTSIQVNGTDITTTASGGFGGYAFSLNGSAYQPSGNFSGIRPGADTVRVMDN